MTSYADTYTIVASPADATETVVASVTVADILDATRSVHLHAYVALALDDDLTAVAMTFRRTNLAGPVVASVNYPAIVGLTASGALPLTYDARDTPGNLGPVTYVLTLTCTGASGPSTVNAVALQARYD